MPENCKIKLKAYFQTFYNDSEGSVAKLVVTEPYETIDPDPWSDRLIMSSRQRSISLKNMGLEKIMDRCVLNSPIDIEISIPILTECELKKKKLESEIQDIEKRLAKLTPMKEEIAALESKLKEDCSGN